MVIPSLSRPASPQLPTFTPPRSSASTPNRYGGSSPPLGAVAEKIALSYAGVQNYRPSPRISRLFTPVRIPLRGQRALPAFGAPASLGSPRELVIPVFTVLHPSRPWPFLRVGTHASSSSSGYPTLTKRRTNSDVSCVGSNGATSSAAATSTSALRIIIAVLGTVLACFLLVLLGFKWMVRPLASLVFHKKSYTSGEPSTLIFEPAEIERVWRWEIASGNYPSSRPIDGPLARIEVSRVGEVKPVGSVRIENPGLAPKAPQQLSKEKEQERLLAEMGTIGKAPQEGRSNNVPNAISPRVEMVPIGPGREYIELPLAGGARHRAYPPRPIVGSALDMDVVMEHCDFSTRQYVRDCLEVLRVNGGLETPLRRGNLSAWRTTFLSLAPSLSSLAGSTRLAREEVEKHRADMTALLNSSDMAFEAALASRQKLTLTAALAQASPAQDDPDFVRLAQRPHPSHPTADPACDPDHPHLFHIFWAGPFTDKPYLAALSFLYTQRLGLDRKMGLQPEPNVCRPQLWIWINPGAASSLPDHHAVSKIRKDLADNPWSAPLLHPRFGDVVKFRLWNTTEQLDGVEEMKGWREMGLFNSGGVKYGAKPLAKAGGKSNSEEKRSNADGSGEAQLVEDREDKVLEAEKEVVDAAAADPHAVQAEAQLADARELEANPTSTGTSIVDASPQDSSSSATTSTTKDELFERVGSTSRKYDRLTVVLSDMARFVLTHRFGGVYLDADTILLRDWEELFNWHGAFAYRWSRLEKYNTAVLKMQRGSALGNFLFRSAVANDLDFHPMTISRYTKDAGVEGLLLRLPDALFDPAWLNTEYYQRDRPAFPYFQRFEDFFETPAQTNAASNAAGFDAFFKGAFSYHFHNFWWMPFDGGRNWPDLGKRFAKGERVARGRVRKAQLESLEEGSTLKERGGSGKEGENGSKKGEEHQEVVGSKWGDDERDFDALDWSDESVEEDWKDLSWSAVLKRTFEAYVRGETPNLYGEWLNWDQDQDDGALEEMDG
ncbi:BQ2448_311 [Microbotryum intermedium]|uniref:BQ2448_311 protein n=1 Tax=Microbotryum intermedium TaxID=269621 RepID=A0A238F235_9BASI|nr:BQ2448_311 [Microbotryum intermedium]